MKKKIAGFLAAVLLIGTSNFAWAETAQKETEEKRWMYAWATR